jgi:hypothetical protein
MSNKLPLYAVDKCPLMCRVPAELKVKLDRMASDAGLSLGAFATAVLDEAAKDQPFEAEDLMRVNEIIAENIRKRDQRKLRKGAF